MKGTLKARMWASGEEQERKHMEGETVLGAVAKGKEAAALAVKAGDKRAPSDFPYQTFASYPFQAKRTGINYGSGQAEAVWRSSS